METERYLLKQVVQYNIKHKNDKIALATITLCQRSESAKADPVKVRLKLLF